MLVPSPHQDITTTVSATKQATYPPKKLPMLLFLQALLKLLQWRIPCPMHYTGSFFKGGFFFNVVFHFSAIVQKKCSFKSLTPIRWMTWNAYFRGKENKLVRAVGGIETARTGPCEPRLFNRSSRGDQGLGKEWGGMGGKQGFEDFGETPAPKAEMPPRQDTEIWPELGATAPPHTARRQQKGP